MTRPRLLLDVDGVLCDFTSSALDYLRTCGVDLKLSDVRSWHIFENHRDLESGFVKHASQPGYCYNLPLIQGADSFVARAREHYDIRIVTTSYNTPLWCYERTRWVEDRLKLPKSSVVFCSHKEEIRGDVFVDDKIENVAAWQNVNGDKLSVLMDQPWNARADESLVRVLSLDDLSAKLNI